MQTLTENIYHLAPPRGLFDETVIFNLFPGTSVGVFSFQRVPSRMPRAGVEAVDNAHNRWL